MKSIVHSYLGFVRHCLWRFTTPQYQCKGSKKNIAEQEKREKMLTGVADTKKSVTFAAELIIAILIITKRRK
jgi:hypothetical protein